MKADFEAGMEGAYGVLLTMIRYECVNVEDFDSDSIKS